MKTKLLTFLLCLPIFCFSQFRLVKDINSGINSSLPHNFIEFNGNYYFFTDNTGSTSERCHLSNNTELGTLNLVDGNGNELIPQMTNSLTDWAILNGELFFPAQNLNDGVQLYKTNGLSNAAELVLQINGSTDSNPADFTVLGNFMLFSANDNINGRELWITDGTTAGTQLLKDIDTAFDGSPKNLFAYNGNVYFTATDITNGEELWITDGTNAGTQLVKDIAPGATDSTPRDFISYNGKVYFTANDGSTGRELWVTDGTDVGTMLVQDLNTAGSSGSFPSHLTVFNDNLVFAADVTGVGLELVKMNPSQSITSLGNLNPSGDSNPNNLTVLGGMLYFSADNGTSGRELYSSNGFQSGTGIAEDINMSGDSNPDHFIVYNGKLYFSANDGTTGVELWSYDFTNGAQLVEDLNAGPSGDSYPVPKLTYGNELVLTIDQDGSTGVELWSYIDPSFQTFVPDDNFEQYLIGQGLDSTLDDFVPTGNINNLNTLNVFNTSISDFTGIEDFISLKIFNSSGNGQMELDLSQNSSLEEFSSFLDLNMTSLILTANGNPNLGVITVAGAQFSSLDLSGFTSLGYVNFFGGNSVLTSLNLEDCTNSNLIVDISNLPSFSSINLTNATAVKEIYLFGDTNSQLPISSIDTSFLTGLTDFFCRDCDLQDLDLSTNTLLNRVDVQNSSQLSTLNVKNSNNNILTTFNATGTNLPCVEVDDETAANAGTGSYASWQKDVSTLYSENCAALSLDDVATVSEISLYPNPVNTSFQLKDLNFDAGFSLTIYDITGKRVALYETLQDEYSIENLKSGLYLVKVNTKKRETLLKLLKD